MDLSGKYGRNGLLNGVCIQVPVAADTHQANDIAENEFSSTPEGMFGAGIQSKRSVGA